MQGGVHRRDIKVPGRQMQGTSQGPSPIHAHIQCTGHNATADSFNIIGTEDIYGTEFFLTPLVLK